jgi:hypothetical protein
MTFDASCPSWLAEEFRSNHPRLFPEGASYASRFVVLRPGWYDLVRRLLTEIEKVPLPAGFAVVQVKSKAASLRVTTKPRVDAVEDLIRVAGTEASRTCEVCRRPGEFVEFPDEYVLIACPDHRTPETFTRGLE